MNKRIDHKSVVWMAKTGFHPKAIAERLGCSRRQVDRILKANGIQATGTLMDFTHEHTLWRHFRKIFKESDQQIAWRFGVTRQAVHKFFQKDSGVWIQNSEGNSTSLLGERDSNHDLRTMLETEYELVGESDPHLNPLPGEETFEPTMEMD